ncbi:MAG: hypothetical protein IPH72_30335 [Sandaracinaceae bacterium]|nr:hypothetical protein [Sandaracinaceae bacterium]
MADARAQAPAVAPVASSLATKNSLVSSSARSSSTYPARSVPSLPRVRAGKADRPPVVVMRLSVVAGIPSASTKRVHISNPTSRLSIHAVTNPVAVAATTGSLEMLLTPIPAASVVMA